MIQVAVRGALDQLQNLRHEELMPPARAFRTSLLAELEDSERHLEGLGFSLACEGFLLAFFTGLQLEAKRKPSQAKKKAQPLWMSGSHCQRRALTLIHWSTGVSSSQQKQFHMQ